MTLKNLIKNIKDLSHRPVQEEPELTNSSHDHDTKTFSLSKLLPENIANTFGLNVAAETSHVASKVNDKYIKDSTLSATALSNFLSYRYFDSSSHLFFSDDDITGFCLEINPIVGFDSSLEKNLSLFFNSEMPENCCLQFLLIGGHHIDNKINLWKKHRTSSNEMLSQLTHFRDLFINKMSKDFSSTDGRMGRDFRIFVSFSKKGGKSRKGLDDIFNFQDKLFRKFKSLKLSPKYLNASDLINITGEILEVETELPKPKNYSPLNLISDQILTPLSKVEVEDNHIKFLSSGWISKCFFPLSYPENFSLPEMINLLGSDTDNSLPARLIISYTIASDINIAKTASLLKKGRNVLSASEQFYSRNDIHIKKQASEWREIFDKNKSGQRFLSECMQVMISCPEKNLSIAEESLTSLYNSLDWILKPSKNLQLPSVLSILPMQQALYLDSLKFFKLFKLAQSSEIVAKLPIQGEWKGVGVSGVLLQGRRGELFNWNPFVRLSSGNYNVAVMAPSGSGKSVLLQELATTMLAQNTSVFVLDIGGSYQNICELLGGEIFKFNNLSNISLNPFASMVVSDEDSAHIRRDDEVDDVIEILNIGNYKITKDSIIYVKSIVSAMCGIKGDALKEALIEKAINEGISIHGPKLDLTKLSNLMGSDSFEKGNAAYLSQTLFPYTDKGVHGRFFKSGKAATFKEAFTVFEFEEVKNDPVLLSVILQVILMQVTQQFLVGDRSRQFMLIVDEAWMILEYSASFLEAFARTVRKYGGSLVICVQNFNDFKKTPERRSILENSTWTIMLKQDEKGLGSFRDDDEFSRMLGLIESISLAPGKYAEALIFTSGLKIVGRLILDPYSLALYSTDAKDYKFLQERKKEGLSKDLAVKELARKYGDLPEEKVPANQ